VFAAVAKSAEGLRKPVGGSGEGVATFASAVGSRRPCSTGHPELMRRRDEEPQERRSRPVGVNRRDNGESRRAAHPGTL
jgi:hypothetical protein